MKILVPIDFSDHSLATAETATDWAAHRSGRVDLLHVIPEPSWRIIGEGERASPRDSTRERLQQIRSRIITRAPCEYYILDGTPHREIIRFAQEKGYDLIAIATHGRSAIERFFLGSTTERVMRNAATDVLVLRGAPTTKAPGPEELRTVVAAVDLSESSPQVVSKAARLAADSGGELLMIHVLDDVDPSGYGAITPEDWEAIQNSCMDELAALRSEHAATVPTQPRVLRGIPSVEINRMAREVDADVVVVAPRADSGHLLGATAERVVRGAPCSAYIVKTRKRSDRPRNS